MGARCLVVVAALNASGFAQDDAADPKPNAQKPKAEQEITREAWDRWLGEVRDANTTALDKLKAIRAAAENSVIVNTSRIRDIRAAPPEHGEGSLEVDLGSLYRGHARRGFIVPKKRVPQMKHWKAWDRIVYRTRVTVKGVDHVVHTMSDKFEELRHTPSKEISREEWDRRLAEIRKAGGTTLARFEAIKRAAEDTVVLQISKVRDIRPAPNGAVEVLLCGLAGEPRYGFYVRRQLVPQMVHWKKWDRLGYRTAIEVRSADELVHWVLYRTLVNIKHSANPGLSWPKFKKVRNTYPRWKQRYDEYVQLGLWRDAYRVLKNVNGRAFSYDAVITELRANAIGVRIANKKNGWIAIEDPQLLDKVRVGQKVVLALLATADARNVRELRESGGHLRFEYKLWRLK